MYKNDYSNAICKHWYKGLQTDSPGMAPSSSAAELIQQSGHDSSFVNFR